MGTGEEPAISGRGGGAPRCRHGQPNRFGFSSRTGKFGQTAEWGGLLFGPFYRQKRRAREKYQTQVYRKTGKIYLKNMCVKTTNASKREKPENSFEKKSPIELVHLVICV